MFLLFAKASMSVRKPGSEFSTLTAIINSMIAMMTGALITGNNLLNFRKIENLFRIFWSFDFKVGTYGMNL